nr:hypothetical protein [uncultured Peptostreptococcus sp.]
MVVSEIYFIEKKLNIKLHKTEYGYYFEDPFLKRKSILLNKLDSISSCPSHNFYTLVSFIDELFQFSSDIYTFDLLLCECIEELNSNMYNHILLNLLIETYECHFNWSISINKFIKIIINLEESSIYNIPKLTVLPRLNIDISDINVDFPYFLSFKKYTLNNNISFEFIPKKNLASCEHLNLVDICVLRSLHTLFINNVYSFNFKTLFKFMTYTTSRVVTKKQENLIKQSFEKIKNFKICIYNKDLNSTTVENLIYTIHFSHKNLHLILKDPLIYRLAKSYNLYTSIDSKIYYTETSITSLSILIKEYLIYRIFINTNSFINIIFSDIYSDLKSNSIQNNKRIRDFIIRMLEYWRKNNYIKDYNIVTKNNIYIYFTIIK